MTLQPNCRGHLSLGSENEHNTEKSEWKSRLGLDTVFYCYGSSIGCLFGTVGNNSLRILFRLVEFFNMSKRGTDKDYWMLRDWGVGAITALKMVGMAYIDTEKEENEK